MTDPANDDGYLGRTTVNALDSIAFTRGLNER